MHNIEPYSPTNTITLFDINGPVQTFSSKEEVLAVLGARWVMTMVGRHFSVWQRTDCHHVRDEDASAREGKDVWVPVRRQVYQAHPYILRDDQGGILVYQDLAPAYRPYGSWLFRRYPQWNGEGPVPGIRKYRGGRRYCRRLRTTNERRQAQRLDPSDVLPRGRRSVRMLPNAWDDYIRGDRDDRSWKRYRKHQWKREKKC